jgi:hypothetical protein
LHPLDPHARADGRDVIAAFLAEESDRNPAWIAAVVFDTARPMRMPINSGRDYGLFAERWRAEAEFLAKQADGRHPQFWERNGTGWYQCPGGMPPARGTRRLARRFRTP